MSVNKYANLPDIDTAPDIYETEDVFPSSQAKQGDSSDEESGVQTRHTSRGKIIEAPGREELDNSSLIGTDEASRRFKRAERKSRQDRSLYKYPPSRSLSPSPSRQKSLSARLRLLQNELASLENEVSDPSNPLLQKEREESNVDPGELIKGLVDVRARLDKVSQKEGRSRLVQEEEGATTKVKDGDQAKDGVKELAEMDRRVGEVEKLIGSSSTSLDEASPMPTPLLLLLSRLNTQVTVLTQPRHLDNISRRLKLLLSDLDRVSSANQQHRRQSHHNEAAIPPNAAPSALQEQITPILTRLVPSLPHIPHILMRLRTLSALHTSAAEFQSTLEGLEEEQKKAREALEELSRALDSVEGSLDENRKLVEGNVSGLEERVQSLLQRVEQVSR
ncbi:hypothetical protein HETIRDRAFT_123022 [Heterobasidion irregulare TC 32-1]|uniref:Uncharacterized protein n=1 Tax=Heterobasidion irregulare (strain TC 32-1) TaxID=747525 RepID=W4K518_HETIT|nr:uncharacterized protein HETIRDRAFT_123022 [Heterobasidion irregulare TC 32-1]ETW80465.1 hypothetical protein HETIRDRAFT_123022 [Heterobasidion irregulare TC 32-1]